MKFSYIFRVALDNNMGVALLRTQDGLDYTGVLAGEDEMAGMITAAAMQTTQASDLSRAESGISGRLTYFIEPCPQNIIYITLKVQSN
jgi:hypothetical protein